MAQERARERGTPRCRDGRTCAARPETEAPGRTAGPRVRGRLPAAASAAACRTLDPGAPPPRTRLGNLRCLRTDSRSHLSAVSAPRLSAKPGSCARGADRGGQAGPAAARSVHGPVACGQRGERLWTGFTESGCGGPRARGGRQAEPLCSQTRRDASQKGRSGAGRDGSAWSKGSRGRGAALK